MNIKKIIIATIAAVVVIAVFTLEYQKTDKARAAYTTEVLRFVTEDVELLDYDIDPAKMTGCVVNTSVVKMRGTRFDSLLRDQYDLYTTWIKIKLGDKVYTDIKDIQAFGVEIAGSGAHTNFGVSYQYCIERVAPFNQQQTQEDDDWGRKVAINVRLWWNDLIN
jgi:hypothetical protein